MSISCKNAKESMTLEQNNILSIIKFSLLDVIHQVNLTFFWKSTKMFSILRGLK